MRVLLIIPAYNEEKNIQKVIERVRAYRERCDYTLDYVVINDGSTDQTRQVCRENGIHHIDLLQNLGIGGAVQTGYIYARREGYDFAVQFDGDGQHDPESLSQLLAPLQSGQADFCIGIPPTREIILKWPEGWRQAKPTVIGAAGRMRM